MLLAVRDYFVAHPVSDLQQLVWHFKQPPEVIRDWLGHWIRKGCVVRQEKIRCSECTGCSVGCRSSTTPEVYSWSPERARWPMS